MDKNMDSADGISLRDAVYFAMRYGDHGIGELWQGMYRSAAC